MANHRLFLACPSPGGDGLSRQVHYRIEALESGCINGTGRRIPTDLVFRKTLLRTDQPAHIMPSSSEMRDQCGPNQTSRSSDQDLHGFDLLWEIQTAKNFTNYTNFFSVIREIRGKFLSAYGTSDTHNGVRSARDTLSPHQSSGRAPSQHQLRRHYPST